MVQNIDENTYNLLKKSLDAVSARQNAIAQNIANVNTKGYKAFRVVFEDKLKEQMDGSNLSLTKTNEKHMDANNSSDTDYEIVQDNTTSMNQDGNNVDIDNEMTNLAANTIKYEALINEANSQITMRNFVINGGK